VEKRTLSSNLWKNKTLIEEIYKTDRNKDLKFREFVMTYRDKSYDAFIVFFDGMADDSRIDDSVLAPLMILGAVIKAERKLTVEDAVFEALITHNQLEAYENIEEVIPGINFGSCALFIDGSDKVFVVDAKGFPMRGVGTASNELVIKGPQQGFVENMRDNVCLIRKIMKNENLISEEMRIGMKSSTPCSIMYMDGEVDKGIVDEIRKRMNSIAADFIFDTGELEQLMEERPMSPFSQIMSTERPDLVAISLSEGQIAILVDGSSNAMILPIDVTKLMHASDDKYLRMPYAMFTVGVRTIATFLAFVGAGLFVAISSFHHELLPVELLFAVEVTRDKVPFITVLEVIILEIAFELIREAAMRVQGVMGGTLGIVGGLILGQAAVEARIISPVTIVVVALCGLCSFAIPNYYLEFSTRLVKYVFIILGYLAGFLGIAAGAVFVGIEMCSLNTMGIPYFAPFAIKSGRYKNTAFLTRSRRSKV